MFEEFEIDPLVLEAIYEMGYENPTPIQKHAIPAILQKKDLIALAETGSGKTAACAIPICHLVDTASTKIQALIVVPTRELALQYAVETQKIGKRKKVSAFALYGGEDMDLQRAKLKSGVHVLVATPGRLIDFIYSRAIDLNHVETLILDEADQMFGMGFYDDLEFIIQCLVHEHRTLLFSATMPKEIRKIAQAHMQEPEEISLISKKPSPKQLSHQFIYCPNPQTRREELLALLKEVKPTQCLIFANSRREVEALYRALKAQLSNVDFLHGGLEQKIRSVIMGKFQRKKIRYLVATDIASRGLDFSHVTHVINFHFPFEAETYLHRAGRTGRSGKTGTCITLVIRRDLPKIHALGKTLQKEPEWLRPPPSSPSQPPQKNKCRGKRGEGES
ncbi:MAG: DEAD-box ATP-dependent RNA helicase CshA [Chlamydiae bacterium]|nr:DEAD-box ATP-dependent RNA helicase CshA [Chlamydiota bacterium]